MGFLCYELFTSVLCSGFPLHCLSFFHLDQQAFLNIRDVNYCFVSLQIISPRLFFSSSFGVLFQKFFHWLIVWALWVLECMVLKNVFKRVTRILKRCLSFCSVSCSSMCPTRSTSSWSPSRLIIALSAWRTSWRSWHPLTGPLRGGWHTALRWQPSEAPIRRHAPWR